jgi:hypothetical protein
MFAYDAQLAAAAQALPQSIPDVLQLMQAIDNICVDGDGLKWFNAVYLQLTQVVEERIAEGGLNSPAWVSALDVQFAKLYFDALYAALTGAPCPGCWKTMFSRRDQRMITRIQFALAGLNGHINFDLPLAVVATCKATNTVPRHGTAQYKDYTAITETLDGLMNNAKQTLNVRLLGDPLPTVSRLEDLIATWDLTTASEKAWNTAEMLWNDSAGAVGILVDTVDALTTVIGRALLVPLP